MTTALTIPRRELRPGIKRYADSDSALAWDVYLDDRLVASEYVALADARMELDFAVWYALFSEAALNPGALITDEALGLATQVFHRLFSAEKIQEKALTAREKIIASGIYSVQSDGSLNVLASSSRGKQSSYTVTSTCTCKDFFTHAHLRGGVCKHIAARMLLVLAQHGVGYLKHLRDALDATPVIIHTITPAASAPIVPEATDDAQHALSGDAPGLAFLNIGAADLAAALFLAQRAGTPVEIVCGHGRLGHSEQPGQRLFGYRAGDSSPTPRSKAHRTEHIRRGYPDRGRAVCLVSLSSTSPTGISKNTTASPTAP